MPITPRFQRVAALRRPFVDRDRILAGFAADLAQVSTGPRVLNVTGIGGIGKTRLLRELQDRAAAAKWRTAVIDLQVPAMRRQDEALAALRAQLGRQGADFDRFDIAYAVQWQRLHPHLRLNQAELSFIEYGSLLGEILRDFPGLPFFGTAVGLLKLADRGTGDVRRRLRIHRDPTLKALDGLPNGELADAVTFLFAEDLRASSDKRRSLIVVDSYEALVPSPVPSGRTEHAGAWLRDLTGQLDLALTVIASREPLRWETIDPEWADIITTVAVDGLPMAARLELLEAGGISEPRTRQAIAEASAGLPFYLHLAVDTQQRAGGSMSGVLVSRDEILARFLQHVAPEEVRTLDVLAPARIFDYEIFRGLTVAFDLPGSRLAWDSLTSYSFVYPAGDGQRLHQLIQVAITGRLPAATLAQVHAVLGGLWDDRARQGKGIRAARACREAAYHGMRAGTVSAASLLGYADLAIRHGGHAAAGGIAQDLEEWLDGQPGQPGGAGGVEMALALRCLRAEAAVRLGEAAAVTDLTGDFDAAAAETGDPVTARLAVAAGNGQRIAGNTGAALAIFTRVWDLAGGPPKLAAGLWASDLLMCQGNFRAAERLAAELEALVPEDEAEFRGDVARMRHLSRRFGFDYDAAGRYLEAAASFYETADSVLGLANTATNRAELLALTSPGEAVAEAARAIGTQREIGAHHEIGKAYTALGVAHLRLGELDRAEAALRSAFDALDRAGYRSGRARADLYLAAVHGRSGRLDEALASLRLAVAGLEAADVYPTLIACAARMLAILGVTDDGITASADRAANRIRPPGTLVELDAGITGLAADLLGGESIPPPDDLYREATARAGSASDLSGFYNHNVKLATPAGPVIVRLPIPGSDLMDLSIWPEADVLRAIRSTVSYAPRLLYAADKPRFLVMEFIEGDLLDDVAPRGVPVPGHVIGDVADMLAQLASISREKVPPLPAGWPGEGRTGEFARRLSAITAGVYSGFRAEFGDLFAALGIPGDPLAAVLERWAALTARPFRLLHTDIHRKNMIIFGGRTYFIDWQLALWGDPVYDLAVHLHKMGYSPAEQQAMKAAWLAAMPGRESDGWEADLGTYLSHERVKSAIVDTVRYAKLITAGTGTAGRDGELAGKLAGKLAAAYATGVPWPDREPPPAAEILRLIRRWSRP